MFNQIPKYFVTYNITNNTYYVPRWKKTSLGITDVGPLFEDLSIVKNLIINIKYIKEKHDKITKYKILFHIHCVDVQK